MTKETVDQYYPEGATTPAILPALTAENEYLADSELLKMLDNIEGINDWLLKGGGGQECSSTPNSACLIRRMDSS